MDEIEQFLEQLEHGNQSVTDGQMDRGTEGQRDRQRDKPKLIFPRFLRKAGDKKNNALKTPTWEGGSKKGLKRESRAEKQRRLGR